MTSTLPGVSAQPPLPTTGGSTPPSMPDATTVPTGTASSTTGFVAGGPPSTGLTYPTPGKIDPTQSPTQTPGQDPEQELITTLGGLSTTLGALIADLQADPTLVGGASGGGTTPSKVPDTGVSQAPATPSKTDTAAGGPTTPTTSATTTASSLAAVLPELTSIIAELEALMTQLQGGSVAGANGGATSMAGCGMMGGSTTAAGATPSKTGDSTPLPTPGKTAVAGDAGSGVTQSPSQLPTQTPTQLPTPGKTAVAGDAGSGVTQSPTQLPTQTPTQLPAPGKTVVGGVSGGGVTPPKTPAPPKAHVPPTTGRPHTPPAPKRPTPPKAITPPVLPTPPKVTPPVTQVPPTPGKGTTVGGESGGGETPPTPGKGDPTQNPPVPVDSVSLQSYGTTTPTGMNRDGVALVDTNGDSIELYGDPHVVSTINGTRDTYEIGKGLGSIRLDSGAVVTWDTTDGGLAGNLQINEANGQTENVSTKDGAANQTLQTGLTTHDMEQLSAALKGFSASTYSDPLANTATPAK